MREDNPELTVDEASSMHNSNLRWEGNLKDNLRKMKQCEFHSTHVRPVLYRPFVKVNCYADYTFVARKYQMDRIFPESSSENRLISVSGIGSKKAFSSVMIGTLPDYQMIFNGQCFPRYRYQKPSEEGSHLAGVEQQADCVDNISDTALDAFQENYHDDNITKDSIFDYVYGVLHAPGYREEFANDLSKELPRIPFAPDFQAFAEAGKALGDLHIGYETCERYPLKVIFAHEGEPEARHFRLTEKAMRFADDEENDAANH